MSFHKIVETIFTIIMLLFLATLVLGILVAIALAQELAQLEVGFGGQFMFIAGMFLVFLYITKMIVDKIKDYHRYSND